MLRLSRKADYALISLGYLAEREGRVSSAREIASACQIPAALLMNILKSLHQHGVLSSIRGASGGYRIGIDLHTISLLELCKMVEQVDLGASERLALHGPAQALQYRLSRFMREVSVADLVLPGRRIDVPLERVGVGQKKQAVQV
ncbi:MAG TPA: Rrf2 family transcriptional regulator [Tepidisphaeraceae bacterium]|jgi:Rrf2 family protein